MKRIFKIMLTATNPIIKNHKVHDQTILPGLAYIDMIYQLVEKTMGFEFRNYSLKRLSIANPLIVGKNQMIELNFAFDRMPNYWQITVLGGETDSYGKMSQEKLYITAELHEEIIAFNEQINPESMKQTAVQIRDVEMVYKEARRKGLIHQGIIKAEGNIYATDSEYLIEINVADAYQDKNGCSFLFHPTLIDGTAMAAGFLEVGYNLKGDDDLYLPLFYESFSAIEPLYTHCYAVVKLASLHAVKDIRMMDMAFFNIEGKQIAELKGTTSKQVRFKGQINPDLKTETISPTTLKPATLSETSSQQYYDNNDGMNVDSSQIQILLQNIFSKHLNIEASRIDLDTGFYELGLLSSQLLAIVHDIESALNLSLNPTLLFEYTNLIELTDYLRNKEIKFKESISPFPEAKEDHIPAKKISPIKTNTYEFYEHEPFLQDHLVYNQPALMGVTHPCLALETYIQNNPHSFPVQLKNIEFMGGPVTLKKMENVHIEVQLDSLGERMGFKTLHYKKDTSQIKPCCQGEFIGPIDELPETIDIEALLGKSKPIDGNTIKKSYHTIKDFTIGGMMQTIDAAFIYDKSTVIGKICLTGKLKKGNIPYFIFDPLLLASCYALDFVDKDEQKDNIFIPLMIERLTVFRPMTEIAYILKTISCRRADFISFDALVLTEEGDMIAEIINASEKEVLNPSLLVNASFDIPSTKLAVAVTREVKEEKPQALDIAIIGLSGRYPQSPDITAFWENLRDGKDCITEIPRERWDWKEYFSDDWTKPGCIYSKWGGFINDVDRFDPLFFNISPRDAETMDPQERLFLEHCWQALEDAGYTREKLHNEFNSQIGVYVGVMHQEYPLYAVESSLRGERLGLGGGISSIATRISYFCDFHGPSMAVDTMCSSSLTSLYLACQALKEKHIAAALAGGVNLTIHPNKYLTLSRGQFISSKGHCESFGEGGDGYIPGEGVGVLFLKRLVDAERDHDHIYAVIKGTAINHGGKTSGYTVPNPNAQSLVIASALKESGIDPRTISYIEAHGTGTKLGDPIEIAGLTKAFWKDVQQKQYCWIGSAKSNIGHCESAAGVAGITKVLLQMQHGKIVPSLHSERLNPNINFIETPFIVNQELRNWEKPIIDGVEYPRRAGISSFGAGGLNAHAVVEEYIPKIQEKPLIKINPQNPAIIVLSAKNEERLKEQAQRLLNIIKEKELSDLNLADMAYTLQLGREAMDERLAMIVESIKELEEKLKSFIKGHNNLLELYRGQVKPNKETLAILATDEDMVNTIDIWINKRKYAKLLELWAKGLNFDWNKLYRNNKPYRISLPTYPFSGERYWALKSGDGRVDTLVKTEDSRQDREIQTSISLNNADPNLSSELLVGNIMLVPVWDAIPLEKRDVISTLDERVAIIGGTIENKNTILEFYSKAQVLEIESKDNVDEIARKVENCGPIDHIFWIISYHSISTMATDALIEEQNLGVLLMFKMIKALLHLGYGVEDLGLSVITFQTQPINKNDAVNPTHASLHGLIGSLAKEYPNWKIRLIDLEAGCNWPITDIFTLPPDPQGNAWVYRAGEWYRQKLIPYKCPPIDQKLYRTGGVYVVIGGAGGIGETWSEYMIGNYQARIIWIGRRQKDETIQAKLDRLATLGTSPIYIAADATRKEALQQAYDEIKQYYPSIHGVIQSAIVLLDQSLANMDEKKFHEGLAAKVDVSVRMAQVFCNEPLDFIMFFSSVNSFFKAAGQSNYVAGCTFKDIFAHQLSCELPCAVKVMNWGYWGTVGAVASKVYQDRMARSGFGSIDPPEAMKAMDILLAGPMDQIAFFKTTKPITIADISFEESIVVNLENPKKIVRQKQPNRESQKTVIANNAQETLIQKSWEKIEKLLDPFQGEGGVSDSYGLLILQGFQSMGFFENTDQKIDIKSLFGELGRSTKSNKVLNNLLNILRRGKLIEIRENYIFLSETGNSIEARNRLSKVVSRLELLSRTLPELSPYFSLLNYCIENYPLILKEKISSVELFASKPVLGWCREIFTLNNKWDDPFSQNTMLSISHNLAILNSKTKITIIDLDWIWNPISRIVLECVNKNRQEAEYFYIEGTPVFQELTHKAVQDNLLSLNKKLSYINFHPFKDENEIIKKVSSDKADIVIIQGIQSDTRKLEYQLNLVKELKDQTGLIIAGIHPVLMEIFTLTFGLVEDRLLNMTEPDLSDQDLNWNSVFKKFGYHVESSGEWLTLAWQELGKDSSSILTENRPYIAIDNRDIITFLKQSFSSILHIAEKDLDIETNLQDYGLDSITTSQAYISLQKKYGKILSPKDLLVNTTIKKIANFIERQKKKSIEIDTVSGKRQNTNSEVIELAAGTERNNWKQPVSLGAPVSNKLNTKYRKPTINFDESTIQTEYFETSTHRKYEIVSSGDGPAIMFLAGLAFTWKVWRHQIPVLQKQYRLIFPHVPGHGKSVSQSGEFTFEDITDDLQEILDNYQIDATHLVGWCMGGNIAQYFAARYPKKLKSLVLVGTTPTDARVRGLNSKDLSDYSMDPLAIYVFEFRNCLSNYPFQDYFSELYLEYLEESRCQINNLYVLNYIDNLFQFDSINFLKNINAPTLVIAGKWDVAFPTEQVKLVHQGIASSKYIEFDYSGHLPFLTQHDLFNNELLKFLAIKEKGTKPES